MNDWKFVNQLQPQTLVIATFLCYIDAFFGFFGGGIVLLVALGLAAGGFGIANEKKWGYAVAVASASLQLLLLVAIVGSDLFRSAAIITLLFDGALVALLLHPMSREYQRIWFK